MKKHTRFSKLVILLLSSMAGCAQDRVGEDETTYRASFKRAIEGNNVEILDIDATFRLRYYQPEEGVDFAEVSFLRSAPDADPEKEGNQCPEEDPDCDVVARYNLGGFIPIPIRAGTMEFEPTVEDFMAEGSFKAGIHDIGYMAIFNHDLTEVEVQTWLGLNGDDLITVTVFHSGGDLPIFDSSQAPE